MELGTGLMMDIAVLGILLLSTIWGARKGLALTVSNFMQWFVCLILGFVFCHKASELLADYTGLEEWIRNAVESQIETTLEESPIYRLLPDLFNGWIDSSTDSITSALMTIIAFLFIVFGIKLISFLVTQAFSRKYNDGVTGFIDGLLGFLFGLGRGLILAMLFFAVLVPILGLFMPGLSASISDAMETSSIAKIFYDENVLLILIRDIFV